MPTGTASRRGWEPPWRHLRPSTGGQPHGRHCGGMRPSAPVAEQGAPIGGLAVTGATTESLGPKARPRDGKPLAMLPMSQAHAHLEVAATAMTGVQPRTARTGQIPRLEYQRDDAGCGPRWGSVGRGSAHLSSRSLRTCIARGPVVVVPVSTGRSTLLSTALVGSEKDRRPGDVPRNALGTQ
jgi:hypothetical protein